jgi:hypothetical protein
MGTALRITEFLNITHRLFRKLHLFPPSDEERETPTLLGPLRSANLNHWTKGSSRLGA